MSLITYVEMPKNPIEYGVFKIKGLVKTIFRFEYVDGKVNVENDIAFLLDAEDSKEGKVIKLKITPDMKREYEEEIEDRIRRMELDYGFSVDKIVKELDKFVYKFPENLQINFKRTFILHMRAFGTKERNKYMVDKIKRVGWNKEEDCFVIYFKNGDWWHYTLKHTWY